MKKKQQKYLNPFDDMDEELIDPHEYIPDETGGDLSSTRDLTPRQLVKSVLAVYSNLGGDQWLLTQARSDPQMFVKLLLAVLPKSTPIEWEDTVIKKDNLTESELVGALKNQGIPLPSQDDMYESKE